jgi:hypothetical protein
MSNAAMFGLQIYFSMLLLFALMLSLYFRRCCKVERKAQKLLTEWLSRDQKAQYERNGHFEVTGCHSGRRYRIRSGRQMNVEELDGCGATVAFWCFGPEGPLPLGDIMLAQKIALETNEYASLAIANGSHAHPSGGVDTASRRR